MVLFPVVLTLIHRSGHPQALSKMEGVHFLAIEMHFKCVVQRPIMNATPAQANMHGDARS